MSGQEEGPGVAMVARRCLKPLQSSDITIFTHTHTHSFTLRVTDTQTLTQLTLTGTHSHSPTALTRTHSCTHTRHPQAAFTVTQWHPHKLVCTRSHTYTHSRSHFGHTCSATLTLTNLICSVTRHSRSHPVAQTFPDTRTLTRRDPHSRVHSHSLAHTHPAPFPNRQG